MLPNNFLFQMVHPVTQISLNALALEILEALFITGNGKELQPTEISHASEILTLYLPEEVTGDGVLKIRFKGILDDDMKGLYRCKFDRPDGVTLFSAVTQFEPTFARKAFPCWDEPSFKAYFDIDVQAEQGKTVLSNMPEQERTSLENGSEVVHFKRTPLMSSYLIAIAVGDFEFIEDHVNDIQVYLEFDSFQVRVYTSPGKKEQGRFGLEVAARVLPFYDKFFKIPYPLPKLDMIALTVISGAMENWGLITYQETMLLVDPENTSSIMKQTAAIVVAHEIAHMWFGNLVTMEWWTDLWLKEGFATFMEFLSIDRLYPEFHIWDQFVEDAFNPALEMDALENSHPVEVQVENPAQVHEIFDNISYSKGAAIIRMLHDFLSDEPFSNGLQSYLAKNKYGNTQTDNLWEALEGSSSVPVAAMMSTWTRQKGFPVISATLDGQEVQLQQACFTSLNTADATLLGLPVQSARTEKWMIPIKLIRGSTGEVVAHTVMKDEKLSLQVPPLQACEWIKLNPGTVAFYRVCYEKDLLMRFQPAIEGKTLPPLDRLGLLNDLYAMVISGKCSTNELLSFLRFYREEEEYPVWCSIANIIQKILALLEYSENFEKFRTFAVDLLTPIRQKVGWDPVPNEGESPTERATYFA
ncbi:unnamed protein product [Darwinula stevensoni]|uniref:Aminopeptidase n=1 Tax=Darwinula stevensoni TaxID=69355 RepID=A0A7R9A5S2_9CRUS|nr:unnamed protein product [Darwinula stevensoni]CAG0887114.1 unnamed protein product [Darwinula stevensoni]